MYSTVVGYSVLNTSTRLTWLILYPGWFFWFAVLSVVESGTLKSSADLWICLFLCQCTSFCFMYFESLILCRELSHWALCSNSQECRLWRQKGQSSNPLSSLYNFGTLGKLMSFCELWRECKSSHFVRLFWALNETMLQKCLRRCFTKDSIFSLLLLMTSFWSVVSDFTESWIVESGRGFSTKPLTLCSSPCSHPGPLDS